MAPAPAQTVVAYDSCSLTELATELNAALIQDTSRRIDLILRVTDRILFGKDCCAAHEVGVLVVFGKK